MRPEDRIHGAVRELAVVAMCMLAFRMVSDDKLKGISGAIFEAGAAVLVMVILVVRAIWFVFPQGTSARRLDRLWRVPAEAGVRVLVGLAAAVAGTRRAHLADAWRADLFGDPDGGGMPSARRRLGLAGGDVVAAFRCRVDDLAAAVWGYADRLLASWRGSVAAVIVPAVLAAVAVVFREGFYGLVANAENLGCIGTGSFLAVKGLRAYRGISAPKRPSRKKQGTAGRESAPGAGG